MIFGKHINRYYLKYLHFILLGVLALLLVDIFQLRLPELYRLIIDGIDKGSVEYEGVMHSFDLDLILEIVAPEMLLCALALVFGRFLWRVCLFGSAIRVETDIRRELFDKARGLSQQFYHKNKVGNLMALFTNDLETIHECFGDGILMFFDALLLGVLAILKMANMNLLLTLFALIPMVFLFLTGMLVGRYMTAKWRIRQEAYSALSDFSQENFSGIAVIKAFVKEARELWAFRKLNKQNEDANVEFTKASTTLHILVTLFVESVVCIILGYGGYLVYTDYFSAGQLVEFISYFTSIVWPVMAISRLIDMRSKGNASLTRISEFLDTPPDIVDKEGAIELENPKGEIQICNLSFTYPDAHSPSLIDIDLHIQPGESIGIIGRTGSGKTTLVDLLARIYNVPDGTVFIDGVDINSLTVSSVRGAIAYVPQDNFLFSTDIRDNIAFSRDEVDDDAVQRAAEWAAVHDNIEGFSEGYRTHLGERGVTVSGGQKQRISIARALLKDAPILILDDSVSAVDTATEEVILSNLKEHRRGRTTILIAHRVSVVEGMDKIVYIDEGRILDYGTHAELLERCAEYRRTVELQRLDDEGGASR
ncbi:MAG: ABC transporter ATP-binding protein [Clostridia bacterium]|nr:ABC transporter ATP-binding protein [Clostridia bacterium]